MADNNQQTERSSTNLQSSFTISNWNNSIHGSMLSSSATSSPYSAYLNYLEEDSKDDEKDHLNDKINGKHNNNISNNNEKSISQEKKNSSYHYYTDNDFENENETEKQNGFFTDDDEEHLMWRNSNEKQIQSLPSSQSSINNKNNKNNKNIYDKNDKINNLNNINNTVNNINNNDKKKNNENDTNLVFKRKSRTNTFNNTYNSPYSNSNQNNNNNNNEDEKFKSTKSHNSFNTFPNNNNGNNNGNNNSMNQRPMGSGKILKFDGVFNSIAKSKEIVLFNKIEEKCFVVSLSPIETREQFVANIIDHFKCFPPYYPSHLMVSGTALSLEPRWLFHEVDEGYTYEIGFFLIPFDKVDQKAKFEPEALLLLQNFILEKGCQYLREGNLRDSVVTKDDMERIIQEEKHKSIESYPSLRHTKYFAVVDETVAEFLKLIRGEEWEFIKNKDGVQMFRGTQRRVKSSCNCMKGVGIIKASPKLIKDILIDPSANKRKYNTLLQSVKDVEIIDKRTKIVHLKYISKKWGISFLERSCDMVILYHWYQEKDGTFIIAGKSIEHEDVPEYYDCKRAFVYSSGYEIKQYRSEKGEIYSKVTYISHVNLGVNLPQFLVKIVEESQPLIIAQLNQFIQTQIFKPSK